MPGPRAAIGWLSTWAPAAAIDAVAPSARAATSASKAAGAQAEAAKSTAKKAGDAVDTGTGALQDRTVEQLRNRASELDIEGRSNMKKDELVKAIRDAT